MTLYLLPPVLYDPDIIANMGSSWNKEVTKSSTCTVTRQKSS